jgi:hypothetical protein
MLELLPISPLCVLNTVEISKDAICTLNCLRKLFTRVPDHHKDDLLPSSTSRRVRKGLRERLKGLSVDEELYFKRLDLNCRNIRDEFSWLLFNCF